jgi:hypothetical protein
MLLTWLGEISARHPHKENLMFHKSTLTFYAILIIVCILALVLLATHASFSVNLLPMF